MKMIQSFADRVYILSLLTGLLIVGYLLSGCAGPKVLQDDYAELQSERTFEYPLKKVWTGIEATLQTFKGVKRDPGTVDSKKWDLLRERTAMTDWTITESRDKYVLYDVDGSPRRKKLKVRLRYGIRARQTIGGTRVRVGVEEQIEKLDSDGMSTGFKATAMKDSSLADEMLKRIKLAVLSGAKP